MGGQRACQACLRSLYGSTVRNSVSSSLNRSFHSSRRRDIVKPFLLADIGEGTRECQVIQWFVKPGARVEQFDKICEVQSDKAATDITSPFDGVIKKLHYEPDDMAIVGKPLVDIDIQSEISEEDVQKLGGGVAGVDTKGATESKGSMPDTSTAAPAGNAEITATGSSGSPNPPARSGSLHRSLATPAVRHLCKEMDVRVEDIHGTGKDGRVTKEDVHKHVGSLAQVLSQDALPSASSVEDKRMPLTPVQTAMFKTMTRSLTIPHFLYTSTVEITNLTSLRKRINTKRDASQRITPLAFILKAVSLALQQHPLLNSSLDTLSDPQKPQLTYRGSHNFGIAVDTPSGLMVPVIRDVQDQSVAELAKSIRALSDKAVAGRLQTIDMQGATFTVSNIGSIGGGVVAPIIVEPQVAIVGVGRGKIVPGFDDIGNLVQKEELVLSWSADHRVVDGAECARAAERVRAYLEDIEEWALQLR